MFKKCAFTSDVTAEYEAFKTAFGIGESENAEIVISQNGTTLVLSGVDTITTISQSGNTLVLA